MKTVCKFDKNRDLGIVFKGLAPDINDLIENHKVSDVSADVIYNEISNIEEVGCRINDDFDLYKYYKEFGKHMNLAPASSGTGSSQGPAAHESVAE